MAEQTNNPEGNNTPEKDNTQENPTMDIELEKLKLELEIKKIEAEQARLENGNSVSAPPELDEHQKRWNEHEIAEQKQELENAKKAREQAEWNKKIKPFLIGGGVVLIVGTGVVLKNLWDKATNAFQPLADMKTVLDTTIGSLQNGDLNIPALDPSSQPLSSPLSKGNGNGNTSIDIGNGATVIPANLQSNKGDIPVGILGTCNDGTFDPTGIVIDKKVLESAIDARGIGETKGYKEISGIKSITEELKGNPKVVFGKGVTFELFSTAVTEKNRLGFNSDLKKGLNEDKPVVAVGSDKINKYQVNKVPNICPS